MVLESLCMRGLRKQKFGWKMVLAIFLGFALGKMLFIQWGLVWDSELMAVRTLGATTTYSI